MLIDFKAEHIQYLKGRPSDSGWVYTPANPKMPAKGKYLAAHQVFSNNALNAAIYIRNDVNSAGEAISVHTALRLTFSHKAKGRYLLNDDPDKLSLNLGLGAVRELYRWLSEQQPRLEYEIVRASASPKRLQGFTLQDGQFARMLTATEFDSEAVGTLTIQVGLSDDDVIHLQFYCLGYAKLIYPTFTDVAILQLLKAPASSTNLASNPFPVSHAKSDNLAAPQRTQDDDRGMAEDEPDPVRLERCRKAIYAVGMQRWKGSRDVIEFIQDSAPIAQMDRLIKDGNAGEFTEWNRIADMFKNS